MGQLTRRLLALQRFESVSAADIMGVPWIEQDLNNPVPGHDGRFDVVVAAEVIEHLQNPRFMIRENIFGRYRSKSSSILCGLFCLTRSA